MIQVLGDYKGFFAMQKARLIRRDMDISGCSVSHLAFRTETYEEYLDLRDRIEQQVSRRRVRGFRNRTSSEGRAERSRFFGQSRQ